MSTKLQSLLDEARTLRLDEQIELAEKLLAGLDVAEGDVDAELLPMLEARWQAFERGEDVGEDAFEAIEDMRKALKARSES